MSIYCCKKMDWWIENYFMKFDHDDNRPLMQLCDEWETYLDGADIDRGRVNYCPSCGFKFVNEKFRKRFD